MYIIVKGKEIIAAHDDEDIITEYLRSQDNSSDMELLKVKKKKSRELEQVPSFLDVYLVRYGDFYVPYSQYEALKNLTSQRDFDLKYCRDILFRLLEEGIVEKKDIQAVKKTLNIVMSQIESLDDNDYETLRKIETTVNEWRK